MNIDHLELRQIQRIWLSPAWFQRFWKQTFAGSCSRLIAFSIAIKNKSEKKANSSDVSEIFVLTILMELARELHQIFSKMLDFGTFFTSLITVVKQVQCELI